MANKKLCDGLRASEFKNGRCWVSRLQSMYLGAQLSRKLEMTFHQAFVVLTKPFLPHVYREKITVKTLRNTMAALQHALGVTARRDANQDPLLAAEKSRNATALERLVQLIIHHFRHKQQSQLAQLG